MNHPVAEFLKRLPNMRAPEVFLEDDGDLCFDWDEGPRCNLTVSLSASGRVGWAALFGDEASHGRFELAEWPESFTALLCRHAGGT